MTDMALQGIEPLSRFFRLAVVAGVKSAVQIHIDRGDDLNARDDKGQTPLMLSAARNSAAICKLLLSAGADASLFDPLGRDALGIAREMGASEAVSVIEASCALRLIVHSADDLGEPALALGKESKPPLVPEPLAPYSCHTVVDTKLPAENVVATVLVLEPATSDIALLAADEFEEFDLGSWEAEEEHTPPEDDPALVGAATKLQAAITEHQPIDNSADWDDFDAFLPDVAAQLPRGDDTEALEQLRLVFLLSLIHI